MENKSDNESYLAWKYPFLVKKTEKFLSLDSGCAPDKKKKKKKSWINLRILKREYLMIILG